jgi:hypothetical protein
VATGHDDKLAKAITARLDPHTGRELGRGEEMVPAEGLADPGNPRKRGQRNPVLRKLFGPINSPPPELSLRGGDGAEYSVRVEASEFTRSAFLHRLVQLLGDLNSSPTGTRYDVVVQRRGSQLADADWTWRQTVAAAPKEDDLILGWDPRGAVVIALPRVSRFAVDQLEIIRLNPANGHERPLPGTLIHAARLPVSVRPAAVLCTQDGRTIAGGMAEDPTGDGWWIASW